MKCLIALCALVAAAVAYPDGAPENSCSDMLPDSDYHGSKQNGKSPYIINVYPTSIRPGDKVRVTLNGSSFKGFLIQARVGDEPVGKFEPAPFVKLINCGNGVNNAATHEDNMPKERVVVMWSSPPDLSEHVTFYVTTVKDLKTYWVKQKSEIVSVTSR